VQQYIVTLHGVFCVSSPVESLSPRKLCDSSAHHPKHKSTIKLKTLTLSRSNVPSGIVFEVSAY
jgi:hypothetical protein